MSESSTDENKKVREADFTTLYDYMVQETNTM